MYWLTDDWLVRTIHIFALRQYGRWLRDNWADLENNEVWQSLAFAMVLFVIYAVYTSDMGKMAREYLSQVISIVIIGFFVWRVETLQELPSEEDMNNGSPFGLKITKKIKSKKMAILV